MADVKNGYTRIANELLEAILDADLSKRELLVVFAVCRKTYGWNKKKDDISHSQIAELTGLKRQHIGGTILGLVQRNILTQEPGKFAKILGLNKSHKTWSGGPKTGRPKTGRGSQNRTSQNSSKGGPKTVRLGVPKQDVQKTTPKDNQKKRELRSQVRQVYDHWVTVMGKDSSRTKLTSDRRTKIQARLKDDYTVEQIFESINGYAKSAHHMGDNPQGKKYNDIELICRDGKHLEACWPENMAAPQPTNGSAGTALKGAGW